MLQDHFFKVYSDLDTNRPHQSSFIGLRMASDLLFLDVVPLDNLHASVSDLRPRSRQSDCRKSSQRLADLP